MITFVTYFVNFSESILDHIDDVYDDIAQGGGYLPFKHPFKMIQIMFQSILKHHKNARLVLITDEVTKVELPGFIEIHRIPRQTDKMEIEMLQAKIWALRNMGDEGHIIFLDSDMVVRDNLEHIFDIDGDVFFTYRQLLPLKPQLKEGMVLFQPINIGFIAVRHQHHQDVATFFEDLITQFSNFKEKKYAYWIGLQFILKEIFMKTLIKNEEAGTLDDLFFYHRWTKIKFLNADIYNFAIEDPPKILPEAKVIHFKGVLGKPLMFAYWKMMMSNKQRTED